MMLHRELFTLIARLAPTTRTFRAIHMAHAYFQTSPQRQHEFRVRSRKLMIDSAGGTYMYVLPNRCADGPRMKRSGYRTGFKLAQAFHVNGTLHGLYTLWHTSEQRKLQCSYVRGYKHGECVKWFVTGQIQCRDNYIRGTRHGMRQKWYMSGVQRNCGEYNMNVPIGTHTRWYVSGNIREQTTYYDDITATS